MTTLTCKSIEEVPRQGKSPFWRVATDSFKIEVAGKEVGYTNVVVWSSTLIAIIKDQLIGTPAEFTLKPEDNPRYAPSAQEVRLNGTLLYPTEEHKAAEGSQRRRSSSNKPPQARPEWAWETPEERAGTRTSIEAQKAGEFATAIVTATLQPGDDVEAAMKLVETWTGTLAAAIRKAASDNLPKERPGAGRGNRPVGPGSEQPGSVPTDPASGPPLSELDIDPLVAEAIDKRLQAKHFPNVGSFQRAYAKHHGKAPDLTAMTVEEVEAV